MEASPLVALFTCTKHHSNPFEFVEIGLQKAANFRV